VTQNPLLQGAQLLARLEPELVHEHSPRLLVRLERVRLAAGAVEREHQLRPELFAQRVLFDQLLDLTYQLGCGPEREIGLDPLLERREPQLLEPAQFVTHARLVRQVFESATAPKTECRLQLLRSLARLRALRLRDQPLEAREVEVFGIDPQDVPGRLRQEQVGADRLAQAGDVVLERGGGGLGGVRAPEFVDQPVARDRLVRMQKQVREEDPEPLAAQEDGAAVLDDRQWAENAEFDGNVAVVAKGCRSA
jgi:hypothetical protein